MTPASELRGVRRKRALGLIKRVCMTLLTRYEVQRVKYLASELVPPLYKACII